MKTIYLLERNVSDRPALGDRDSKPFGFVSEDEAKLRARELAERYPSHRWYVQRKEPTGGPLFLVAGDPP